MARPPSNQPTDAELEILKALWEHGPAGLGQVHAAVQENRPVALTTTATTLKVMLTKGLVERQDGPRGYLWSAATSRETAASGLLGKLVHHVFDGSARRLVAHLIEEGELSARDREEIRALLEGSADDQPRKPKGGRR